MKALRWTLGCCLLLASTFAANRDAVPLPNGVTANWHLNNAYRENTPASLQLRQSSNDLDKCQSANQNLWLVGLYVDQLEERDDPNRFFRW